MKNKKYSPDVIIETSWEVCNKVGGVHTVLKTKANTLVNEMGNNLIMIGPDVYRDSENHPEFIEEPDLYSAWQKTARKQGLSVRVGRWNIESKPIAIMVDFTPFISAKDQIFGDFWESFELDSISGQWDYIEPVLFGYASGKVIESFTQYHFTLNTKIVAQFHEWLSGAGVLYLSENVPNIASSFTAHATILGRSLAAGGYHLYNKLKTFDELEMSAKLDIVSKQSLEKICANTADVFTSVSEITAKECKQFHNKKVDIVTPNGFEDSFVPKEDAAPKREVARDRLIKVAQYLTGQNFDSDVMIVSNGGRYEFKNKGIDLFIDAIGKVNNNSDLQKDIIAFIFVGTNHYGAKKGLLNKINNPEGIEYKADDLFVTHGVHDADQDEILNRIKKRGFTNRSDQRVKVIYVPAYLDGNDGIFNLDYFDVLIGMDLTVFPSYYEPWGYTPLESIALSVPSVTTSLTGFGSWINENNKAANDAITVVNRTDTNDGEVIDSLSAVIQKFATKSKTDISKARKSAYDISRSAQWSNLIETYKEAYYIALKKVEERKHLFKDLPLLHIEEERPAVKSVAPIWYETNIQATVPERFIRLKDLSKNLWWSWNYEAVDLFHSIDENLWKESRYNPVTMLEMVSIERFEELSEDKGFTGHYDRVIKAFDDYMNEPFEDVKKSIAYFSMEYGFHDSLKIFSGGLGILAGDYLKEASDSRVNMTGIGLLYRMGYFKQTISISGEQLVDYPRQDFAHLPIIPLVDEKGNSRKVSVVFPGRTVFAKIWQVNIGRIKLYLLDTDIEENSEADRDITHSLYGGDNEHRFKQEMILGIGGIRALDSVGFKPELYHCNEGHAAFIGLERLRKSIYDENQTFQEAIEYIKASSLFTTHTPVPAGHDSFNEDLVRTYMAHYPSRLHISWNEFLTLGKINVEDRSENFSMSHLALNLSQECNAVSWLHGEVSKDMFAPLYPGYFAEESHIHYVTNGVHYESWTASAWQKLYTKTFGSDFSTNQHDFDRWKKIYDVKDEVIWNIHKAQKKVLIDYLKERVEKNWIERHENPNLIVNVKNNLNENSLIIGFARRFATYKRAFLLFSNLDRLAKLVNNPDKPVIFLFAGKAHPMDKPGQELIKKVVEVSKMPQFLGKILFVQNYDIELAKKLVQGVDIWLNTPTRPLEASGTSGMKAVMNGGLHFSVLDGWWVEGYQKDAGWALPMERTYEDQELQNQLDVEILYNTFEQDVVPSFYDQDKEGVSSKWAGFMKNSIAHVAPQFTMRRMIDHYKERFYEKQIRRSAKMKADDFKLAYELSVWKKQLTASWDKMNVVELDLPIEELSTMKMGEEYKGKIIIDLHEIKAEHIGVELVCAVKNSDGSIKINRKLEFDLSKSEGRMAVFQITFTPYKAGTTNYGVRIYPKNSLLPHRQDIKLVKWV
jgi:glycogen phosphorylase/synthase